MIPLRLSQCLHKMMLRYSIEEIQFLYILVDSNSKQIFMFLPIYFAKIFILFLPCHMPYFQPASSALFHFRFFELGLSIGNPSFF
jgi:hypothetical protein